MAQEVSRNQFLKQAQTISKKMKASLIFLSKNPGEGIENMPKMITPFTLFEMLQVTFVGESCSGKSSIVRRYLWGTSPEKVAINPGGSYYRKLHCKGSQAVIFFDLGYLRVKRGAVHVTFSSCL